MADDRIIDNSGNFQGCKNYVGENRCRKDSRCKWDSKVEVCEDLKPDNFIKGADDGRPFEVVRNSLKDLKPDNFIKGVDDRQSKDLKLKPKPKPFKPLEPFRAPKRPDIVPSPSLPILPTQDSQQRDDVIQSISFVAGWNWFSINVQSDDMSINNVLSNLTPTEGDFIKSFADGTAQYYDGDGWFGGLENIEIGKGYQIQLASADELIFTGSPVDPASTPIELGVGWNWIGYLPQESLDINDALNLPNPTFAFEEQEGDFIKSFGDGSAQYYEEGWFGGLETLDPGKSYQVQVAVAQPFTYLSPSNCTDEDACNYNANATEDDGSCFYCSADVAGTTPGTQYKCRGGNPLDCTVNLCFVNDTMLYPGAIDGGICSDQGSYGQCNADVVHCSDGCDPEHNCCINDDSEYGCGPGCTDMDACNYNSSAIGDDGSCEYCNGTVSCKLGVDCSVDFCYDSDMGLNTFLWEGSSTAGTCNESGNCTNSEGAEFDGSSGGVDCGGENYCNPELACCDPDQNNECGIQVDLSFICDNVDNPAAVGVPFNVEEDITLCYSVAEYNMGGEVNSQGINIPSYTRRWFTQNNAQLRWSGDLLVGESTDGTIAEWIAEFEPGGGGDPYYKHGYYINTANGDTIVGNWPAPSGTVVHCSGCPAVANTSSENTFYDNVMLYNVNSLWIGNVCPPGWHAAMWDDWEHLAIANGGFDTLGSYLKNSVFGFSGGCTDNCLEPEFGVLPHGYIETQMDGSWIYDHTFSYAAKLWGGIPYDETMGIVYYLTSDWDQVQVAASLETGVSNTNFSNGFSVRCVEDGPEGPPESNSLKPWYHFIEEKYYNGWLPAAYCAYSEQCNHYIDPELEARFGGPEETARLIAELPGSYNLYQSTRGAGGYEYPNESDKTCPEHPNIMPSSPTSDNLLDEMEFTEVGEMPYGCWRQSYSPRHEDVWSPNLGDLGCCDNIAQVYNEGYIWQSLKLGDCHVLDGYYMYHCGGCSCPFTPNDFAYTVPADLFDTGVIAGDYPVVPYNKVSEGFGECSFDLTDESPGQSNEYCVPELLGPSCPDYVCVMGDHKNKYCYNDDGADTQIYTVTEDQCRLGGGWCANGSGCSWAHKYQHGTNIMQSSSPIYFQLGAQWWGNAGWNIHDRSCCEGCSQPGFYPPSWEGSYYTQESNDPSCIGDKDDIYSNEIDWSTRFSYSEVNRHCDGDVNSDGSCAGQLTPGPGWVVAPTTQMEYCLGICQHYTDHDRQYYFDLDYGGGHSSCDVPQIKKLCSLLDEDQCGDWEIGDDPLSGNLWNEGGWEHPYAGTNIGPPHGTIGAAIEALDGYDGLCYFPTEEDALFGIQTGGCCGWSKALGACVHKGCETYHECASRCLNTPWLDEEPPEGEHDGVFPPFCIDNCQTDNGALCLQDADGEGDCIGGVYGEGELYSYGMMYQEACEDIPGAVWGGVDNSGELAECTEVVVLDPYPNCAGRVDCAGVCNGDAVEDGCEVCVCPTCQGGTCRGDESDCAVCGGIDGISAGGMAVGGNCGAATVIDWTGGTGVVQAYNYLDKGCGCAQTNEPEISYWDDDGDGIPSADADTWYFCAIMVGNLTIGSPNSLNGSCNNAGVWQNNDSTDLESYLDDCSLHPELCELALKSYTQYVPIASCMVSAEYQFTYGEQTLSYCNPGFGGGTACGGHDCCAPCSTEGYQVGENDEFTGEPGFCGEPEEFDIYAECPCDMASFEAPAWAQDNVPCRINNFSNTCCGCLDYPACGYRDYCNNCLAGGEDDPWGCTYSAGYQCTTNGSTPNDHPIIPGVTIADGCTLNDADGLYYDINGIECSAASCNGECCLTDAAGTVYDIYRPLCKINRDYYYDEDGDGLGSGDSNSYCEALVNQPCSSQGDAGFCLQGGDTNIDDADDSTCWCPEQNPDLNGVYDTCGVRGGRVDDCADGAGYIAADPALQHNGPCYDCNGHCRCDIGGTCMRSQVILPLAGEQCLGGWCPCPGEGCPDNSDDCISCDGYWWVAGTTSFPEDLDCGAENLDTRGCGHLDPYNNKDSCGGPDYTTWNCVRGDQSDNDPANDTCKEGCNTTYCVGADCTGFEDEGDCTTCEGSFEQGSADMTGKWMFDSDDLDYTTPGDIGYLDDCGNCAGLNHDGGTHDCYDTDDGGVTYTCWSIDCPVDTFVNDNSNVVNPKACFFSNECGCGTTPGTGSTIDGCGICDGDVASSAGNLCYVDGNEATITECDASTPVYGESCGPGNFCESSDPFYIDNRLTCTGDGCDGSEGNNCSSVCGGELVVSGGIDDKGSNCGFYDCVGTCAGEAINIVGAICDQCFKCTGPGTESVDVEGNLGGLGCSSNNNSNINNIGLCFGNAWGDPTSGTEVESNETAGACCYNWLDKGCGCFETDEGQDSWPIPYYYDTDGDTFPDACEDQGGPAGCIYNPVAESYCYTKSADETFYTTGQTLEEAGRFPCGYPGGYCDQSVVDGNASATGEGYDLVSEEDTSECPCFYPDSDNTTCDPDTWSCCGCWGKDSCGVSGGISNTCADGEYVSAQNYGDCPTLDACSICRGSVTTIPAGAFGDGYTCDEGGDCGDGDAGNCVDGTTDCTIDVTYCVNGNYGSCPEIDCSLMTPSACTCDGSHLSCQYYYQLYYPDDDGDGLGTPNTVADSCGVMNGQTDSCTTYACWDGSDCGDGNISNCSDETEECTATYNGDGTSYTSACDINGGGSGEVGGGVEYCENETNNIGTWKATCGDPLPSCNSNYYDNFSDCVPPASSYTNLNPVLTTAPGTTSYPFSSEPGGPSFFNYTLCSTWALGANVQFIEYLSSTDSNGDDSQLWDNADDNDPWNNIRYIKSNTVPDTVQGCALRDPCGSWTGGDCTHNGGCVTPCERDCHGTWGGTAFWNQTTNDAYDPIDCKCVGGNTGITGTEEELAAYGLDCNGDCKPAVGECVDGACDSSNCYDKDAAETYNKGCADYDTCAMCAGGIGGYTWDNAVDCAGDCCGLEIDGAETPNDVAGCGDNGGATTDKAGYCADICTGGNSDNGACIQDCNANYYPAGYNPPYGTDQCHVVTGTGCWACDLATGGPSASWINNTETEAYDCINGEYPTQWNQDDLGCGCNNAGTPDHYCADTDGDTYPNHPSDSGYETPKLVCSGDGDGLIITGAAVTWSYGFSEDCPDPNDCTASNPCDSAGGWCYCEDHWNDGGTSIIPDGWDWNGTNYCGGPGLPSEELGSAPCYSGGCGDNVWDCNGVCGTGTEYDECDECGGDGACDGVTPTTAGDCCDCPDDAGDEPTWDNCAECLAPDDPLRNMGCCNQYPPHCDGDESCNDVVDQENCEGNDDDIEGCGGTWITDDVKHYAQTFCNHFGPGGQGSLSCECDCYDTNPGNWGEYPSYCGDRCTLKTDACENCNGNGFYPESSCECPSSGYDECGICDGDGCCPSDGECNGPYEYGDCCDCSGTEYGCDGDCNDHLWDDCGWCEGRGPAGGVDGEGTYNDMRTTWNGSSYCPVGMNPSTNGMTDYTTYCCTELGPGPAGYTVCTGGTECGASATEVDELPDCTEIKKCADGSVCTEHSDCTGDCTGSATYECTCSAGQDCNGECGGGAFSDTCGRCCCPSSGDASAECDGASAGGDALCSNSSKACGYPLCCYAGGGSANQQCCDCSDHEDLMEWKEYCSDGDGDQVPGPTTQYYCPPGARMGTSPEDDEETFCVGGGVSSWCNCTDTPGAAEFDAQGDEIFCENNHLDCTGECDGDQWDKAGNCGYPPCAATPDEYGVPAGGFDIRGTDACGACGGTNLACGEVNDICSDDNQCEGAMTCDICGCCGGPGISVSVTNGGDCACTSTCGTTNYQYDCRAGDLGVDNSYGQTDEDLLTYCTNHAEYSAVTTDSCGCCGGTYSFSASGEGTDCECGDGNIDNYTGETTNYCGPHHFTWDCDGACKGTSSYYQCGEAFAGDDGACYGGSDSGASAPFSEQICWSSNQCYGYTCPSDNCCDNLCDCEGACNGPSEADACGDCYTSPETPGTLQECGCGVPSSVGYYVCDTAGSGVSPGPATYPIRGCDGANYCWNDGDGGDYSTGAADPSQDGTWGWESKCKQYDDCGNCRTTEANSGSYWNDKRVTYWSEGKCESGDCCQSIGGGGSSLNLCDGSDGSAPKVCGSGAYVQDPQCMGMDSTGTGTCEIGAMYTCCCDAGKDCRSPGICGGNYTDQDCGCMAPGTGGTSNCEYDGGGCDNTEVYCVNGYMGPGGLSTCTTYNWCGHCEDGDVQKELYYSADGGWICVNGSCCTGDAGPGPGAGPSCTGTVCSGHPSPDCNQITWACECAGSLDCDNHCSSLADPATPHIYSDCGTAEANCMDATYTGAAGCECLADGTNLQSCENYCSEHNYITVGDCAGCANNDATDLICECDVGVGSTSCLDATCEGCPYDITDVDFNPGEIDQACSNDPPGDIPAPANTCRWYNTWVEYGGGEYYGTCGPCVDAITGVLQNGCHRGCHDLTVKQAGICSEDRWYIKDGADTRTYNKGFPHGTGNQEDGYDHSFIAYPFGDGETCDSGCICPYSWIQNCDGTNVCCSPGWIGDAWTDCQDQESGCDLSCYCNDGEGYDPWGYWAGASPGRPDFDYWSEAGEIAIGCGDEGTAWGAGPSAHDLLNRSRYGENVPFMAEGGIISSNEIRKNRSQAAKIHVTGNLINYKIPKKAGVLGASKKGGTLWTVQIDGRIFNWIEGYDEPERDPRSHPNAKILYGDDYYKENI